MALAALVPVRSIRSPHVPWRVTVVNARELLDALGIGDRFAELIVER